MSRGSTTPARSASAPAAWWATWATEPVPAGVDYTGVLRTPRASAALSVIGVALGLLGFLVFAPLIMQGLGWSYWLATGQQGTFAETMRLLTGYHVPFGLVVGHLGLAVLIPVSWALMVGVHRVRPTYLSSVRPGLRWPYLWLALALAFVSLLGLLALQNATAPGGGVWTLDPQPGVVWFLLTVAVTTPLQAAAEEYFFRGYLMQAFGSMIRTPWFGIVASAALFAAFHGSQQSVPLLVDRFAFGVLAGVLVWKTGGLEAAIAAHVANNLSAFALAGLTSSMAQVKAVTVIDWPAVGWDLARFGLFAVLAYVVARRVGLDTTTAASGFEGRTRVQ